MADRGDTTARTALIAAIVACVALTGVAFVGLVAEIRTPGASALPRAATSIGAPEASIPASGDFEWRPPRDGHAAFVPSTESTGALVVADAGITPTAGTADGASIRDPRGSRSYSGSTSRSTRPGQTDTTLWKAGDPISGSSATTLTTRKIQHPATAPDAHRTTSGGTTTTAPSHSTATTAHSDGSQQRDSVATTLRDTGATITSTTSAEPSGAYAGDNTSDDDEPPKREVIRPSLRDDLHSKSTDD